MKTKLFLIITLFIFISGFGQEEKKVGEKNGVAVTYQLLLKGQTSKKDKYLLIVNVVNNSEKDVYYKVPLIKDSKTGKLNLPYLGEQLGFTKIKVRNSKGLFGNGKSIIGEFTNLLTTDNQAVYIIKKGSIYNQETSFSTSKGVKPLVTNSFTKVLGDISEYDLMLTAEILNGEFVSSCGNMKININAATDAIRGDHLVQTTNGRQFIWVRKTEESFVRENSNDYTLTYNKNTNSYNYSTADGIFCEWVRE